MQQRKQTVGLLQGLETNGILLSGDLPTGWTTYLDFTATGTDPILKHPAMELRADGTASFTGVMSGSILIESSDGTDLLIANTGTVQLQNDAETAGINIEGVKPGTWTTYLDFPAVGANPVWNHPAFRLLADGSIDINYADVRGYIMSGPDVDGSTKVAASDIYMFGGAARGSIHRVNASNVLTSRVWLEATGVGLLDDTGYILQAYTAGVAITKPVTVTVTGANALVLSRPDAAANWHGFVQAIRGGTTRWYLATNSSDQFTLLNAAASAENLLVTDAGALTVRSNISVAPAGAVADNNYIYFTNARAQFGYYGSGNAALMQGAAGKGCVFYVNSSTLALSIASGGAATFSSTVTSTGFIMAATNRFYLDGGGDTWIDENSANSLRFWVGGGARLLLTGIAVTSYEPLIATDTVRMNETALYLRSGADVNHYLIYNSGAPDGPLLAGYDGMKFATTNGGATTRMTITATAVTPGANDAQTLGTTALGWADLYMAGQGKIYSASTEVLDINTGGLVIHNAYQLPTTDGALGQVLVTDGSDNVDWDDVGGADYVFQTYYGLPLTGGPRRRDGSEWSGLMDIEAYETHCSMFGFMPEMDHPHWLRRAQILIENVEQQTIYLFDHEHRITALETTLLGDNQ
jgi:hypothetical protein